MAHWSVCVHTAYSSSTLRNEYRKSWFKFINVHYQFAYQKNSQQIVNITLAVDAERTKKLECSFVYEDRGVSIFLWDWCDLYVTA